MRLRTSEQRVSATWLLAGEPPQAATADTPGTLPRQGPRSGERSEFTLDAVGWRVGFRVLRRSQCADLGLSISHISPGEWY